MKSTGILRGQQALSLFSGCGGMDIGIRNAGFDVRACIEIDPNCCDTLRHNVRAGRYDTVVMETDIRHVDPYTLMLAFGLREGELDLLFGGSPCQSFSQIDKISIAKWQIRCPLLAERVERSISEVLACR